MNTHNSSGNYNAELDPDRLIQGERYEARVRGMLDESQIKSTWSDWSPSTSWVSPVGTERQADSSECRQTWTGTSRIQFWLNFALGDVFRGCVPNSWAGNQLNEKTAYLISHGK